MGTGEIRAGGEVMSKHTPGPWVAVGTDPAEGGNWFWIKAQPAPVMRGFTKEIGVVNGSQDDPEQQANARLIAAAPELLEALRDLLLHAYITDVDPADVDEEDRARESRARAAIAKATGEG